MTRRLDPLDVMPEAVARAVRGSKGWFVIGGQAVRCHYPYRPSTDVDFGVGRAKDMSALVARLRKRGHVEVIEKSPDTTHLAFDGVDVSIFVLPKLLGHVEGGALTVEGILATKLHAILDRGTRRDFFDLYVLLNQERLGIASGLQALREMYGDEVNEGLVLRALTYFDDADQEPPLPGEGSKDFERVKKFFVDRVAAQLIPPEKPLAIQSRRVGTRGSKKR